MLRTLLVDGEKGGIGKTLLCHLLVDFYLHSRELGLPEADYPLILFDGDGVNKDFSTYPIRYVSGKVIPCFQVNLSLIEGWQYVEYKLQRYKKNGQQARAIINTPNHLQGLIEECGASDVSGIMTRIQLFPLWLLSRSPLSVINLENRRRLLPNNYQEGLAIMNLHFGPTEEFHHWYYSQFRHQEVTEGQWLEAELPVLNRQLSAEFSGIPLHDWPHYGFRAEQASSGLKLALSAWRTYARRSLLAVESLGAS